MSSASLGMGNAGSVVKSVAVIAALEYLRAIVSSASSGLAGDYAPLIARALITYLEFVAYAQGWIQVPATLSM